MTEEALPGSDARAESDSGSVAATVQLPQQMRLLSALVVLLGLGVFLALPFVLSIGSVVFLPLVSAVVLTVILSPVADRMAAWGLPNVLASLLALLLFFGVVILAFALILQPAIALFDELPRIIDQVGVRFGELRDSFTWMTQINERLRALAGEETGSPACTGARTGHAHVRQAGRSDARGSGT